MNYQKTDQGVVFLIWFVIAFFLSPSPFYGCFDVCSDSFALPFFLLPLSIFGIFSLFNPMVWLWRILLLILFIFIFATIEKYLDKKIKVSLKWLILFFLYLSYSFLIFIIWSILPGRLLLLY